MGEERRIKVNANGTKELSWSHLHYFSPTEIKRGLEKRQAKLALDIKSLAPDLIFLQEIGGGVIDQKKTCSDFIESNTAQDLQKRLKTHKVFTGCRGNTGWWTDSHTFSDFKIETETSQKIVYQAGDNPYPNSLIIEGLATLTSKKIIVLDHRDETIRINKNNESYFFQLTRFSHVDKKDQWWIAINVHGGHKIQHFEQAVATRHYLSQYIRLAPHTEQFSGIIVAGDFNALPIQEEMSMTPWSFDYRWQTQDILTKELMAMNSSSYKPFATLSYNEAKIRVSQTVSSLFDWFARNRSIHDASLKEVLLHSPCVKVQNEFNPFCDWKHKIDHIFVSPTMKIKNHSGIYQQNNWTDLASSLSDHPGLLTHLEI